MVGGFRVPWLLLHFFHKQAPEFEKSGSALMIVLGVMRERASTALLQVSSQKRN